jgi:TonB family protein
MSRTFHAVAFFHVPVLEPHETYEHSVLPVRAPGPIRGRAGGFGHRGRPFAARLPSQRLIAPYLCFATLLGCAVTWALPAAANQDSTGAPQAAPIPFDIPAQPLESALDTYGQISGEQVLYKTSLTAGRRSTKVQGLLTPEAALKTLLIGTGLTTRYTTGDAYTLVPLPPPSPDNTNPPGIDADIANYGTYLGAVQRSILSALCGGGNARPGSYQATLQFWIDPAGAITNVSVLTTTGDPGLDADILGALQDATVGSGPPTGMPQPITMTIAPIPPSVTGDCATTDSVGDGAP